MSEVTATLEVAGIRATAAIVGVGVMWSSPNAHLATLLAIEEESFRERRRRQYDPDPLRSSFDHMVATTSADVISFPTDRSDETPEGAVN